MTDYRSLVFAALAALSQVTLAATAHADVPPGRYTFTTDTVTDSKTGLVWQRQVTATNYDQDGGAAYCQSLALAGGGFRLPTIEELLSIVDDTRLSPSIDTTAFPSTPIAFFWSSTVDPGTPSYGIQVNFGDGTTMRSDRVFLRSVRCVR